MICHTVKIANMPFHISHGCRG